MQKKIIGNLQWHWHWGDFKWAYLKSYSVYTKKGDHKVALLCIYQKSGLQSSCTLYIPKKVDYRVALLCIYQKRGLQSSSTL